MEGAQDLGMRTEQTRYEHPEETDRDGQTDDQRRHECSSAPAGPSDGSSHAIASLIAHCRRARTSFLSGFTDPKRFVPIG